MTSRSSRKPQRKPAKRRPTKPAAKPKRGIKQATMLWQDAVINVSYERNWMGMKDGIAHLEIQVLSPEGAILPITDTGFRSHFISSLYVEAAGGALPYVRAWLDAEAAKPSWKKRELKSRQLSLF